jgi:hypothetical protein
MMEKLEGFMVLYEELEKGDVEKWPGGNYG